MTKSDVIAWYNGDTLPLSKVHISPHDRAYYFGDGIYEVVRVYQKQPFLIDEHLARLEKSLAFSHIKSPGDLRAPILKLIELNQLDDGMIYLQVSRGVTPRAHSYFGLELAPNTLIYAVHFNKNSYANLDKGLFAVTHEDNRWHNCHIKSLNLMANCMAQAYANQKNAHEAILFRGDFLTEGTASNVFMVKNGEIATSPQSNLILAGTRRAFLLSEFRKMGQPVIERAITRDELFAADEVFITSATKEATGIIKLDNKLIARGEVGPKTQLARKTILGHGHR